MAGGSAVRCMLRSLSLKSTGGIMLSLVLALVPDAGQAEEKRFFLTAGFTAPYGELAPASKWGVQINQKFAAFAAIDQSRISRSDMLSLGLGIMAREPLTETISAYSSLILGEARIDPDRSDMVDPDSYQRIIRFCEIQFKIWHLGVAARINRLENTVAVPLGHARVSSSSVYPFVELVDYAF